MNGLRRINKSTFGQFTLSLYTERSRSVQGEDGHEVFALTSHLLRIISLNATIVPRTMDKEFVADLFQKEVYTETVLADTLFEDCTFEHCRFQDLEVKNVVFRNCDFRQCSWINLTFEDVKLQECRFADGTLLGLQMNHGLVPTFELSISGSKAQFCVWEEMNLRHCAWKDTVIKDCNFYGCELTSVSFLNSDLMGTGFNHCQLQKADFFGASNYAFDPAENPVAGATFSSPAVLALLQPLGINIR